MYRQQPCHQWVTMTKINFWSLLWTWSIILSQLDQDGQFISWCPYSFPLLLIDRCKPAELLGKQAVLNIQNFNDNYCILYAIFAHIHPVEEIVIWNMRKSTQSLWQNLIMNDWSFPWWSLKCLRSRRWTLMFPSMYYFYENRNPFPLYDSPQRNRKYHANLLLIMDEKSGVSHYLLIQSLSRLVGDRSKHNGAAHICPYCLYCFTQEHLLTFHVPEFSIHLLQRLEYPSQNTIKTQNTISWSSKTLP